MIKLKPKVKVIVKDQIKKEKVSIVKKPVVVIKQKPVVKAEHITPEIETLISEGYRLRRPETEPHKIYKLCKAGYFKAGKTYIVKEIPGFGNSNICRNAASLLTRLTGLILVDEVFDKTRTGTISKKHSTKFTLKKIDKK